MSFDQLPEEVSRLSDKVDAMFEEIKALRKELSSGEDERITFTTALGVTNLSAPKLRKLYRETDMPVHFDPSSGRPYFFRKELTEWLKLPGKTQEEITRLTIRRLDRKRSETV